MKNNVKIAFGGGLVLLLFLIFIFTRSNSMTTVEFAKRSLDISENIVTKLGKIEDKEEMKSLYKETITDIKDIFPAFLSGTQEYIDIMEDAMELGDKWMLMSENRGFGNRMEMIGESFNDIDLNELATFTSEQLISIIDEIASNENSLSTINKFFKLVSPKYDYVEVYEDGYYDWKRVEVEPIEITKQTLTELKEVIQLSLTGIRTERDIERALGDIERFLKKKTNGVIDF